MRTISIFNNKWGVGKTTLTFHLGYILAEMWYKVLMIDLDPQCNLTINTLEEEKIEKLWMDEDAFFEDSESAFNEEKETADTEKLLSGSRSIHFLLKLFEIGKVPDVLPPPVNTKNDNLHIIPWRLTTHQFEATLSKQWSDARLGNDVAVRIVTAIHSVAKKYNEQNSYDYIIIDTSPSLGILNKVIISTVDGFVVPVQPDIFSWYGIRNIALSLKEWKNEFEIMYKYTLPPKLRAYFPDNFVKFLWYVSYNVKNRSGEPSKNHQHWLSKIKTSVKEKMNWEPGGNVLITQDSIWGTSIQKTYNTYPAIAQRLHAPMWNVPDVAKTFKTDDSALQWTFSVIPTNQQMYKNTKYDYEEFAKALIERMDILLK